MNEKKKLCTREGPLAMKGSTSSWPLGSGSQPWGPGGSPSPGGIGGGPGPEEPPLPRQLPAGREGVPKQCPPMDSAPGPFLFWKAPGGRQ